MPVGVPTAGQQLVTAADSAIANALEANEKTRQSMARCEAANAAASDPEAALDATPKQRKKRSARGLADIDAEPRFGSVDLSRCSLDIHRLDGMRIMTGQECYALQVEQQTMHASRVHQWWQGPAGPIRRMSACSLSICAPSCCRPPARGVALSSAGSDGAQAAGGRNNGKGLRHFSMKVCEKVESKGRTTYNEVADELVGEFSGAAPTPLATSAVHLCNFSQTSQWATPSPERCHICA